MLTVKRIIKSIIAKLYKVKMNGCMVSSINKKYKVAICAIFKNEAIYLKEWIEFHRIIGVEHFYLYNNNSNDEYMSVVRPYIDEAIVTLIQWPKNQAQMECYQDCINNYSGEAQWIGFIDIDEFVVPKTTNTIYEFLEPFEKKRGAVKIYWRTFGASGLVDRDLNGLVIEDFTMCWPGYRSLGKCFYNTNFAFDKNCSKNQTLHHQFWANYKGKNIPPVNVFDKVCLGGYDKVLSDNHPIQINHYLKSYKEYLQRTEKGDVFFKINPHDEKYFFVHEMKSTNTDYSAYKYLVKLKLQLAKEGNCEYH